MDHRRAERKTCQYAGILVGGEQMFVKGEPKKAVPARVALRAGEGLPRRPPQYVMRV